MPKFIISFEPRTVDLGETQADDPAEIVRQLAALASQIDGRLERVALSGTVAGMLRSAKVKRAGQPPKGEAYSRGPHAARLAAREVKAWNERHPIGTPVIVTRDSGREQTTHTSSRAGVTDAGEAVVMLHGISGWYLLERVKPVAGGATSHGD